MDYIINPYWFYWIEVANAIKRISIGTMAIFLVAGIILTAMAHDEYSLWNDVKKGDEKKKAVFFCLAGFILSALAFIFVPSEKTLIEMQIAKLATHNNVDLAIDKIKEIVDYIINAMKEVK